MSASYNKASHLADIENNITSYKSVRKGPNRWACWYTRGASVFGLRVFQSANPPNKEMMSQALGNQLTTDDCLYDGVKLEATLQSSEVQRLITGKKPWGDTRLKEHRISVRTYKL